MSAKNEGLFDHCGGLDIEKEMEKLKNGAKPSAQQALQVQPLGVVVVPNNDALDGAFSDEELDYDEYRKQEVISTDDGYFDVLDEAFGIVPRTDELLEKE